MAYRKKELPLYPKLIHMIWLGDTIPEDKYLNILSFAKNNENYQLYLYVDERLIMKIKHPKIFERENKNEALTQLKKVKNIHIVDLNDVYNDNLHQGISGFNINRLHKYDLGSEKNNFSQSKKLLLKERSHKFGLAAVAADILRLDILYKYGGIYVDTDISCRQSLPMLALPLGFRIYENNPGAINKTTFLAINNHIMISVPGSTIIKDIRNEILYPKFSKKTPPPKDDSEIFSHIENENIELISFDLNLLELTEDDEMRFQAQLKELESLTKKQNPSQHIREKKKKIKESLASFFLADPVSEPEKLVDEFEKDFYKKIKHEPKDLYSSYILKREHAKLLETKNMMCNESSKSSYKNMVLGKTGPNLIKKCLENKFKDLNRKINKQTILNQLMLPESFLSCVNAHCDFSWKAKKEKLVNYDINNLKKFPGYLPYKPNDE